MTAKKLNVYFNEEELKLYEKITNLAKQERRSVNAQIKVLLEEAIESRQQKDEEKQG